MGSQQDRALSDGRAARPLLEGAGRAPPQRARLTRVVNVSSVAALNATGSSLAYNGEPRRPSLTLTCRSPRACGRSSRGETRSAWIYGTPALVGKRGVGSGGG